jgi:hypothetical protein
MKDGRHAPPQDEADLTNGRILPSNASLNLADHDPLDMHLFSDETCNTIWRGHRRLGKACRPNDEECQKQKTPPRLARRGKGKADGRSKEKQAQGERIGAGKHGTGADARNEREAGKSERDRWCCTKP